MPVDIAKPAATSSARASWRSGQIPLPSDLAFALTVSLLLLLIFNQRFWNETAGSMWHATAASAGFMVSVAVVVLYVHAVILLAMPGRRAMQAAASVMFVLAGIGSYYIDVLGALMNRDMMQNVFQTDPAEVRDLINARLLGRTAMGLIFAILVWRVHLPVLGLRRQLWQRGVFIIGGLVVVALSALATSAAYAVFLREHKPIRSFLNPASILWATGAELARSDASSGPLVFPGGKTTRVLAASPRPLLVFLVVGETARAANFQLGGYARHTNPRLQAVPDLIYYPQATSCGTSTAKSLPCMFSHLAREQFDSAGKQNYANVLDMLASTEVDVEWRDNNSGCKGICARVPLLDYFQDNSQWRTPQQCSHAHCYDEVMLQDLPARLRDLKRDTLIVFHQNGSHGPAYGERYPPQFEVFKPACHSVQVDTCSREELVNAYDNSILYTDYNLALQIELLRKASEQVDAALVYASDHGESLGEQGVYLHGMPYAFAPAQQKQVPLLMWLSAGFEKRLGLDAACLTRHRTEAVSHDNLFHTVLGMMGARNGAYDPGLDLLSRCRS